MVAFGRSCHDGLMTTNTDSLKATVRRYIEAVDRQDWAGAKELAAPNVRVRVGGNDIDRDTWVGMGQMFAAAFPDGRHDITDVLAEGDRVVVRGIFRGTHKGAFQGIPATGRTIAVDMVMIDRVVDGRIVEHYVQFDAMSLMQQLGAMPG
jgi:steroid delta-isomerase-like uncharacterized protein